MSNDRKKNLVLTSGKFLEALESGKFFAIHFHFQTMRGVTEVISHKSLVSMCTILQNSVFQSLKKGEQRT